ncbi:MAG TPA: hypothetical protein DCO65_09900, partial [Spartobacteria bacterium]|nr:hypothetical protein [Spartobacteria bacterium]
MSARSRSRDRSRLVRNSKRRQPQRRCRSYKENVRRRQSETAHGQRRLRFRRGRAEFFARRRTINEYDYHFTQRTIKVIFDGALGSRGAALLKPYSDAPETSGYLTEKPEDLKPMFEEALRRGIQVETHAIGDRANRT